VAAKTRVPQFGRVAAELRSQDARRANSETGHLLDAPVFCFQHNQSIRSRKEEVPKESIL
jgi:hypothetical protein